MDDEELQSTVANIIADGEQFVDTELSPDRAEATRYYLGEKFGNEEEGRSQVVLTEVRDAVVAILPQLARIFFGSEQVAEYIPNGPEDVEMAQQATDYARYVFEQENKGFLQTLAVWKDALVRKLGIYMWSWDDTTATKTYRLENVTQSQLELLAGDEDVTLTRVEQKKVGRPTAGEAPEEALFDVELTRQERDGRVRIEAVPPEELLVSREVRDTDDGLMIAHRARKTRGELIALGIPAEVIDEHGGQDSSLKWNDEELARRETWQPSGGVTEDPDGGEANDKILYVRAYVNLDYDGDKVAELRRICTIGPGHYVVSNEPADERPFAIFCPDPEPHTLIGQSMADRLMDMQLLGSTLLRASLDSLSASIFPRMGYVDGQVSVADVLNTAIGAPIRMYQQGALQPVVTPFVGKEALPYLDLVHDVIERRTGLEKGAIGLDADALQSTTRSAANASITASQLQIELLALIFALQTLKPLYRGILRLLIKHQPRTKLVRLRNKFVPIDPRVWDADMDVAINVGLGTGFIEEKIAALIAIATKQEQIIQTLGFQNPVVTLAQYRNTLAKIAELRGFKDSTQFFNEVPPNWQPPTPQPQMTPEQMIAQAQVQMSLMKTERELAIKEAELQLKREQAALDAAREDRKLAIDATLKRYQIDAQFKAGFTEQQLESDATANATFLEHGREVAAQQQEHALAAQQQAHEQMLAEQQQEHQQTMDRQAAAQQQETGE